VVIARYEAMLAHIAAHPALDTATLASIDPALADAPGDDSRAGPNLLRTGGRIAQQAWAQLRHERG